MLVDLIRRFSFSISILPFIALRWLLTPYLKIASTLPATGKIIDLGCGHGLMAYALAQESPGREILGIDHDSQRIACAKRAFHGKSQLQFFVGDLRDFLKESHEGIIAMDVLHYLNEDNQRNMMQTAFANLSSNGLFVFRDVDIENGILSRWARAQEKIMTRIGFTKATELHFQTRAAWTQMAEQAGFTVESMKMSRFPFVDLLFVCRK